MSLIKIFSIILVGLISLSKCEPIEIEMLMPDVSPLQKDSYLCFAKEITGDKPVYITNFVPRANKSIAHHILMYTCRMPGRRDKIWNCGEMQMGPSEKKQYQNGPICRGEQHIIYGWAMDAPELNLPKDVAFKLGPGTENSYLVMQVHYADVKKFEAGATDDSGVLLKGQTEAVPYQAGVYMTVTGGYIEGNSKDYFEAACELQENIEIIPFAYRVHTHKLGLLNSGYLVRNDPIIGDAAQSWIEIGRRSPQLPQMFNPVRGNLTIKKGDTIASRCTIENNQNHRVYIGSTGNDEMCNFYIMYYTKDRLLENNVCFKNGPPEWYFEDFQDSKKNKLQQSMIPSDISIIPTEQIEMLKHHHHHTHEEASEASDLVHVSQDKTEMENEDSELNELDSDFGLENQRKQALISLLKEILISKNE